jgi:hypothetical protein
MPFVPDTAPSTGRFVPDAGTAAAPAATQTRDDGLFGNLFGGVVEPVASMATGLFARPVSQVMGLAAAGREAFPGAPQGDPQAFQQALQEAMTYQPKTAGGQSQLNPLNFIPQLLGRGIQGVANWAAPPSPEGADTLRGGFANAAREGIEQAPQFLGLKAPAAAKAAQRGAEAGAEKLMTSALKPPGSLQESGKGERAVDTMLNYEGGGALPGFNVSQAGVTRMRDLISDLNDEISQTIAGSDKTVNKAQAASRGLLPEMERESKTATPDYATIRDVWERFLDHPLVPGREMPIQLAQEIKQGEMKKLGDTAYGQLGSTETNARKGLVRGLKEKIAEQEPSVSALNAKESDLLNALSPLEKRVYNEAKNNPMGLGTLSHSVPLFIAWMADRSGAFKSLMARALNKGSESLPGIAEKFGVPAGLTMNPGAAPSGPPPQ